ncbi:putative tricarboxylic transport membrane protein [Bacillus mesophilus]|uniref:Tripartite tricarboxylate transporter TctB family protein n=1 Tax=Bacillus mesophilus TaxID=1808955 RepID=A0A6M0Q720_9BACI|nr:tripartite tricarboxylate transporter TctB family protein [Bacillus mesophilus]MBM7660038.1 putative tricarboxylic transport membrane protein [Bacillus mesophilus]NEY70898.1 tripartite tricarboxylate transporter TctB family protein [Bacillus mesophilus]
MIRTLFKADRVGGLITILIGGVSIFEAYRQYPNRMNLLVGDHTLPGLVGLVLVILGSVLLLRRLEDFKVELPKGLIARRLVGTLMIMFAYWYLITTLGYLISTMLVLAALFKIIGSYSAVKSTLYGSITTGVLYLLFIHWLQMPFPKGILGI